MVDLNDIIELQGFFISGSVITGKKIILDCKRTTNPVCPICGQSFMRAPKDYRQQVVEDLSLSGRRCFLRFNKYRINCDCGYRGNEHIEWLPPYQRKTKRYMRWVYAFCKRMSGVDVGYLFGLSKNTVYQIDKAGIELELLEQKEIQPEKLGFDEISIKKGQTYATTISAPDEKKVIDIIKTRKTASVEGFFKSKSNDWLKKIKLAVMDAWPVYRNSVQKYCKGVKVCYDHFHLAQHFSKAIDKLRIAETKKAGSEVVELLKGSRWLLLKNPKNLKDKETTRLNQLLSLNKNLYTAYLLRADFRNIFNGKTAFGRLFRLSRWIKSARSANIKEINVFVDKIERWKPYIANALRYNTSNGFAEGINTKIRVIQRMAYGYKDFEYFRLKILQQFNFRQLKPLFDDFSHK